MHKARKNDTPSCSCTYLRCCSVMNCHEPQAGDDDDVLHSMEASLDLLAGKIAIFVDLALIIRIIINVGIISIGGALDTRKLKIYCQRRNIGISNA